MTKVNGLTGEIMKALRMYADDVDDELDQASDELSKEAVSELKRTSPKQTGDYAKGWSRRKTVGGYIVHNRTDYQLTHLLEHGHMNRDGSYTAPRVHIAPVEEKVIREFTSKAEEAARQ